MSEQKRQPTLIGYCHSSVEAERTEQPKRKVRKIQDEGRTFKEEWELQ